MLALLALATVAHAAGLVDHVTITGGSPVEFTWRFGDRQFPTRGVQLAPGASLSFTVTPETGHLLTLELREFRTAHGQFPAYVVSADGRDVAFRCRQYDEAGFSSAFIDLSDSTKPLDIGLRNLADHPLCLSEA
ncbi:MAG: hypothetical protein GW802_18115, partial [Armatimonadetes bacterium]|nr:hypothetical protein [Armatimonadota bacterium]